MSRPQQTVTALTSEIEAIALQLTAVTDVAERGRMLEEMRAILLELRRLIKESEIELVE